MLAAVVEQPNRVVLLAAARAAAVQARGLHLLTAGLGLLIQAVVAAARRVLQLQQAGATAAQA